MPHGAMVDVRALAKQLQKNIGLFVIVITRTVAVWRFCHRRYTLRSRNVVAQWIDMTLCWVVVGWWAYAFAPKNPNANFVAADIISVGVVVITIVNGCSFCGFNPVLGHVFFG